MKWEEFRKRRLRELMDDGQSMADAMKVIGREWQSVKEGGSTSATQSKRRSTPVSNNKLCIKYVQQASGNLSEEQAKDIALGILEGLIEYSDADRATELRTMQRRAAELFRGNEVSDRDTAERRLGYDLAEFVVLAVIDRNITWESLTPSVLSEGAAPTLTMLPGPSQRPGGITPEEELGLKPKQPSTGARVAGTALGETIKALEGILKSS